jgi:adenylate cyclase
VQQDGSEHGRTEAVIAFIDLAGFSATTDVFGDDRAMAMLQIFEDIVHHALDDIAPLKWIGDAVMLAFDDCAGALPRLGALLSRCREEPRLPLTRTGVHSGSVLRRRDDVFGSTVNIASRLTALARPGELLTTQPMADFARSAGVAVEDLGERQIRSVSTPMGLFSITVAAATDPRWIDPVCKMHAPLVSYRKAHGEKWFCSKRCADAYARNPAAYSG